MLRRTLSMLLVLLLVLSGVSALAAAKEATVVLPETYNAITLRSAKSTTSRAVGYVHDGDEITVLKKGTTWSRIRKESGLVGYIKNYYISSQKRPAKSYDLGHISYNYVNANLRKSRSANAKLIATINRGGRVKLHSKKSGWYKVTTLTTGKQGYIKSNFITKGAQMTAKADLTVREKPNGEEVTTVDKGDKVNAVAVYGNWTLVECEDEEKGYVFTVCLK